MIQALPLCELTPICCDRRRPSDHNPLWPDYVAQLLCLSSEKLHFARINLHFAISENPIPHIGKICLTYYIAKYTANSTMLTRIIRKTGNSLAITLPGKYLKELNLRLGDIVAVWVESDHVHIKKLKDLMREVSNPEHR